MPSTNSVLYSNQPDHPMLGTFLLEIDLFSSPLILIQLARVTLSIQFQTREKNVLVRYLPIAIY